MNLPWRDADYGSVLFVQFNNFEGVFSAEIKVVVHFISALVSKIRVSRLRIYNLVIAASFGPGM